MIAALEERIQTNPKGLVGNRGYARYIKVCKGGMTIDTDKIAAEARFDGKWVLRTNMTLSAERVARKYKELWQVEQVFRDVKSVLDTRPVFHKRDETIRGHVFCSFLALVLRKDWIAAWKLRAIGSNGRISSGISRPCRRSLSRKVVEALLSARHVAEPVARCFRRLVLPCRKPYVKYEWVFRRLSMPGSANTFYASFINLKSYNYFFNC